MGRRVGVLGSDGSKGEVVKQGFVRSEPVQLGFDIDI